MSALRYGPVPSKFLSLAACACMSTATILLSGCASDKQASYVQGPTAQQMAAARKVEMEDDGQPVQSPPARAMRAEEDDPTQPWSPNYGGNANAAPKAGGSKPSSPLRSPNPYIPTQVDAAVSYTSTGTLTRLSAAEADLVIAQAINAHEMRRR